MISKNLNGLLVKYVRKRNNVKSIECFSLNDGIKASIKPPKARYYSSSSSFASMREQRKRMLKSPHLPYFEELNQPSVVSMFENDLSPERMDEIKKEHAIFKSADEYIPEEKDIKQRDWECLCRIYSVDERLRYYNYLTRRVASDRKDERERELARKDDISAYKRKEKAEMQERFYQHDEMFYGMGLNNIFQRFQDNVIHRWAEQRLAKFLVLGPPLIVDLSLLNITDSMCDMNLTLKQLHLMYYTVRTHRLPFHLIFTGVDRRAPWFKWLDERFHTGGIDNRMLTVTEKSYTDLFPPEKLLYLSPDGPKSLKRFDSDRVHIIGGLVDKHTTVRRNLTLGVAKRQNIECRRLPLDEYVQWRCGHKSLTLMQTAKILMDVNMTGDWRTSLLSSIPPRKLETPEKSQTENFRNHIRAKYERNEFLKSLTNLE